MSRKEQRTEVPPKKAGGGVLAQTFLEINPPVKQEQTRQQLAQDKVKPYIPNLTTDNEIPVVLATLQETVTPQRNCIISKTNWTLPESKNNAWELRRGRGTGLVNKDTADPESRVIDLADEFIYRVNPNEGLYSFLWRTVFNYYAFGNVFIELQRTKAGGETFLSVFNHDNTHCLIQKGGEKIGISPQWDKDYLRKTPPQWLPIYPNFEKVDGVERSMLHTKVTMPRRAWYGLPDSITGIQNQKASYHIDKYNLQELENGFLTFTVLQFVNDQMTEDQATDFLSKLKTKFTGEDRERFLAQVVKNPADLAKVHEFGKYQGSFIDYDKHIESKIIKSNNWFELLIGNPDSNSLGDGNRILSTVKLAYREVITPTIDRLSDEIINVIFGEYLRTAGVKEQHNLMMLNSIPKDFYEVDIHKIATRNELRQIAGYKELEGDQGDEIVDNGTNNSTGSNSESTD